GGLAFLISVPTAIVVVVLGLFSLPHIGEAIGHLQPLHGTIGQNWAGFVGIVLALSGVEAIANATGVMKLDPGSSDERPSVVRTSTPAILMVMVEVCIFTALFGLAAHALNGLQIVGGDVNAPGAEGVRDYMLRYMGQVFVGGALGLPFGHIFAVVGAIATNLGATSTDRKLSIKSWERTLMFATFIVMAAIEMSLFIDKPNARYFAVTILAVGLILRGLVQERRMKKEAKAIPERVGVEVMPAGAAAAESATNTTGNLTAESILCAVRGTGRTLDFALREARETGRRLYLLFVREQPFMTEQDTKRKWQEDPEASKIFGEAKAKAADQ